VKTASIAFGSAVVGLLAGCFLNSSPASILSQEVSKSYTTASLLQPDVLPYTSARLVAFGTSVPVGMSRVQKLDKVSFNLNAGVETLEVERYENTPTEFRFAGLSDETFVPPIPIVRYPFTVGKAWSWAGTAGLGSNEKEATAELKSEVTTVKLAGEDHACILVQANIVVKTDGGTNNKRTLKFWIEPMKGIVKRELGFSTTREPGPVGSP